MELTKIQQVLKSTLSQKRYQHSLGVQETAIILAKKNNCSIEKASIAGLIHDCAKDLNIHQLLNYVEQFDIILDSVTKKQTELLHAVVGVELARREFGIYDQAVLDAIRYHTTGRENMTLLEKIIYLADYIEPSRKFPGVDDLRKVALSNLDKATLMATNQTISHIIFQNKLIHHDTISARNSLLCMKEIGTGVSE
ncbi:putative HD superfamily hydrolase involved in NAD metabolism [Anaerosolibacter carboniphilus]|uniref:bis(5'-nucleosyl)-tetraphosphatase (symmetrical) n=1 Tax=Anaerosolibacter carboniphilus TaxID=1417629 RepID=A0A841KNL6_9FIRM|nr:bis(5'-nucleosyl)-tetraphosphatase (symmetrical) YqeK [Anaerosolibacter carboniphilus]MBB6214871.1 putative HD superfamily hydrolase involved in NAD metabolism [Anaerosolibacter carboniphilus]